MKTIVYETPEIKFYTYINDWLPIICNNASEYNFGLSEIESNCDQEKLDKWIINRGKMEYWIPGNEIEELSKIETLQFIWGVFSAIPKSISLYDIEIDSDFFIDGNNKITADENYKFIKESVFEVIAFDSSFFVVQSNYLNIHEQIKNKYQNARDIKDENRLRFM